MKNEFAKFALCKFAFVIYGCKKHEYKIKFSYFYENFNAMYKHASHCTVCHSKFNKISRTEHVINEFAKFAFREFAFAKYAFAKSVRILQIREITELIYNIISISNENVNKIPEYMLFENYVDLS